MGGKTMGSTMPKQDYIIQLLYEYHGGRCMFAIDVRQWHSIDEFKNHLSAHDPIICDWVRGIVIHHTYKPVGRDWRGTSTVANIAKYYGSKGWTAGPHLFICTDATNPDNNGIFQMTPLNLRGVHAASCNATHWGIEVVGNFDISPWSDAQTAVTIGTTAALMSWQMLPVNYETVRGHRETGSPKSCPGRMINMHHVRNLVVEAMQ